MPPRSTRLVRNDSTATCRVAAAARRAGRVPPAPTAPQAPRLPRGPLRRSPPPGPPADWEVLLGYPVRRVPPAAETEAVPVRMYVPYGTPSPPYSLSHV